MLEPFILHHISIKEGESTIEKRSGNRIRKAGGGRKAASIKNPNLHESIERIIDGKTYGDPEKVIHWTTQSLKNISRTLKEQYGIEVSYTVVARELAKMGYSKHLNQRMLPMGHTDPKRNEQFEYIATTSKVYIAEGIPVISLDCKTNENLGNIKSNGTKYHQEAGSRRVLDDDDLIELGSVAPYVVYEADKNTGFVNLGAGHDTAAFAANSILQWWLHIGKETYPNARRLYITYDGGGSSGPQIHLWKTQIAQLAEKTGLEIHISHFPPGKSKWNRREHRLFCFASENLAGKPLIDIETVIDLIGSATMQQGLTVKCVLDKNEFPTGIKVSKEDYRRINIEQIGPKPDWNYIIYGLHRP